MKDNSYNLKGRAFGGIIWKFFEKISMQMMQFVIQIILARLLMPTDYGIVGLLTIFISVSEVFIQKGFAIALVQKKDTDQLDYSSVFFANIIMSAGIYAILYFLAPYIAIFYDVKILTSLMRVLCLNVIIGGVSAVHNAIMTKKLEFKKSFLRNIANVTTQGIVGIMLALSGLGVWALVLSKVAGTLVGSGVLMVTVKWHPTKEFSKGRIKSLFSYSSKLLGSNLLNTVFNNIHSLIIGKFFVKADLGYYQKGQQIPQLLMGAVDGSLNEVLYPILSIIQDDIDKLKSTLSRSMKTSMFIILPLLMGLFAVAEQVVLILLTEKWLPCVPYIRLSCIICAFWPLSARTHALNAIGKSGVTFKLSIIAKIITLIFIFACLKWGIYAIMLGTICASSIGVFITSYYVNKYINYSLRDLLKDLLPTILLSFVMMFVVFAIGKLALNMYIKILIQVLAGITVYVGLAKIFKIESLDYLLNSVKQIRNRR